MTSLQQELESFTEYARRQLRSGSPARSMDDLYDQWREERFATEDSLAIAAALRDLENGERGRPLADFVEDFFRRNGLSEQP